MKLTGILWLASLGITVGAGCLAAGAADPPAPRKLGGCHTEAQPYGLKAIEDSLAQAAVAELLAPGGGPGAACARLGVDTPLFLQIGAIAPLPAIAWRATALSLSERLRAAGLHLAQRSLLRHTTGPCFPPYHVDLRACGTADAVAAWLAALPDEPWPGAEPAERRARDLFLTAGRSLQASDATLDLRWIGGVNGGAGVGEDADRPSGERSGEAELEEGR